ncbi:hypothetical protein ISCGN_011202 [Ixodes scapularis]
MAVELSCGGEEVELVSLLEEQLPRYRLRADTLTEFSGYDNEDWCIRVPCLPNPETLDLSPELIQETLNYFVVSGERLSQMTRTYSDPEALTRLLEEKERDLELAAHIGQGLLAEKGQLCERVEALEGDLAQAQDALTHLRHQLATKAALLQAYAQHEDCWADEEGGGRDGAGAGHPQSEEADAYCVLNRKIHQLEQENSQLKAESQSQLSSLETEEKKEMQLIKDCIRQLSDASRESSSLQEELSRRTEANLRQQQEIASLSAQLAELQRYTHMLRVEAEELRGQLSLSKGLQEQLSSELHEARVRYLDLREAFAELQAQLRTQAASSAPPCTVPSLAHELRDSMARGDSDGYTSQEERRANCGTSIWSEESEESDGNDDSQYSSLSSLGLSPLKQRQQRHGRHLATTPWTSGTGFRLSDRLQVVKPIEEAERKVRTLKARMSCSAGAADASRESSSLQEELSRRTEANLRQQQEIASLSAQLAELQRYTHMLRVEAEELRGQLSLSKGLQEQLSSELHEARVRYLDLREAFAELQAQLRTQAASSAPPCTVPSLAHELRDSMARGDSDGYTSQEERRANCGTSIWSEESEESDGNDDSQYSSLSSLGLSPLKQRQQRHGRHLATTPWTSGTGFRLSDRLQVVKPIEGSETLQAWQRLATPGLGDLFCQEGPGVRLKTTLAAPRQITDQTERPRVIRDSGLARGRFELTAARGPSAVYSVFIHHGGLWQPFLLITSRKTPGRRGRLFFVHGRLTVFGCALRRRIVWTGLVV